MNDPLKDVEAIIEARPELEPEEWESVEKATPWIKAQLRPQVRAELMTELSAQYATDLEAMKEEQQKQVAAAMQEWKDQQKPMDATELQTLLSQEYVTFRVPLSYRENRETKHKEFTLVELPLEVEKKFLSSMKVHLLPLIEKFNALGMRSANANWSEILQTAIETVPEALDVAAELVAVCLNPWGEDDWLTTDWVKKNLSSNRIVKILKAQGDVQKYRDFYYEDFRLFRR